MLAVFRFPAITLQVRKIQENPSIITSIFRGWHVPQAFQPCFFNKRDYSEISSTFQRVTGRFMNLIGNKRILNPR